MSFLVAPGHEAGGSAGKPRAHVVRATVFVLRSAGLTVHLWLQRSRQRRCLRELPLSRLADVGLSRQDVVRETRKHFWQP
jgi:uncharacterized protein YjiS (DUF1127 family)